MITTMLSGVHVTSVQYRESCKHVNVAAFSFCDFSVMEDTLNFMIFMCNLQVV